jgi:hypothetical protein
MEEEPSPISLWRWLAYNLPLTLAICDFVGPLWARAARDPKVITAGGASKPVTMIRRR